MKWLTRLLLRLRHDRASATSFRTKSEAIIRHCQSVEQQTYFFDHVPVDVLSLVLKYLSKEPFSEWSWAQSVHVDDVATVLRAGGTLRAAAREMFTSLERGRIGFGSWIAVCKYAFMVQIMAPQLESMVLYRPMYRKIRYEQLSSLRALTVAYGVRLKTLKRILIPLGSSLEELDISDVHWLTKKMVQAIASHCTSLKVFRTSFAEWQTSLEPIWVAAGNTLVEYYGNVPESELAHIAHYCTRLEKLDLMNIEELVLEDGKEVVDLLQALKTLRVLVVCSIDFEVDRGLSADQLRGLVAACPPDVKIHGEVTATYEPDVSNFVRGVGTHLQVLNLEYWSGTMPRELLPDLKNLEELELQPVHGSSDKMILSVFVEPLPRLQKLSIRQMKFSKMLRIVARSVTNLRELVCSFGTEFEEDLQAEAEGGVEMEVQAQRQPVSSTDFIELLCRNVHLCYVSVDFETTPEPSTKEITDFIPLLKVCACLKHVDIANGMNDNRSENEELQNNERLKEISDACVPLRNKSLSLSVNNVFYLPS